MRWLSEPGIDTHRSRGMEISETCPSSGRTMTITIVSVRKEVPERRSEPINKKLTVSCPLFSTWLLPDASIVENGTRELINRFGSIVGTGVSVGGGTVGVGVEGSTVGEGSSVIVGKRGIGWKGVGVGEAFGAAVTSANGNDACWFSAAEAKVPQPVRRYPARNRIYRHLFIRYGYRWFTKSMSRLISGIRCGRDVGWDGGHAGHRCARRDTRNVRDPQSLTGIDRGRASHAVP